MTFPGNRSQEHSTIADQAIGEGDTVGVVIAGLGVGRVETKGQLGGYTTPPLTS